MFRQTLAFIKELSLLIGNILQIKQEVSFCFIIWNSLLMDCHFLESMIKGLRYDPQLNGSSFFFMCNYSFSLKCFSQKFNKDSSSLGQAISHYRLIASLEAILNFCGRWWAVSQNRKYTPSHRFCLKRALTVIIHQVKMLTLWNAPQKV